MRPRQCVAAAWSGGKKATFVRGGEGGFELPTPLLYMTHAEPVRCFALELAGGPPAPDSRVKIEPRWAPLYQGAAGSA